MVRDSNSIAVDVWMVQARNLRGQCEWLRAFANLSASIAELDAVMATKRTAAEFATAMQQVHAYASLTEDGKAEALEAVRQALEEKVQASAIKKTLLLSKLSWKSWLTSAPSHPIKWQLPD